MAVPQKCRRANLSTFPFVFCGEEEIKEKDLRQDVYPFLLDRVRGCAEGLGKED